MEEGDYVMKTTIDLPDVRLHSAKEVAKQCQTTLRALIEEGLRRVLSDYKAPAKTAFKLKTRVSAAMGCCCLTRARGNTSKKTTSSGALRTPIQNKTLTAP